MQSPNLSQNTILDNEIQEDELSEYDPLKLDLTDEDIARNLAGRIDKNRQFWNKEYDLDTVRSVNSSYWTGDYYKDVETSLYDHQTRYQDNRIFLAVETLIPMALSRAPQPVVVEASETEASRELASNLEDTLLAKHEELDLAKKYITVARHLLTGQRLGVMKYRWDDSIGDVVSAEDGYENSGDVNVSVVLPNRVIIEQRANDPYDVPLISEFLEKTVEDLGLMFDKKKDDLLKKVGITRGVATQMRKYVGFYENWFTYYKDGAKKEAVAWKFQDLVLGSVKNPNWNYDEYSEDDEGNVVSLNYFKRPMKPYVFFNHVNSGKYVIDDASVIEQTRRIQDSLDKRGRQIVDNADQANSGTVYDNTKITPEEMAKIIGHPDEKIGVSTNPSNAVSRLPINLLPSYVIQDKIDHRQEIDNIFGTHAPIRGEDANAPTLGQEVLSQRSDMTRIKPLANSIETGASRIYQGITQLMKVFYDTERKIRTIGDDGRANFINISSEAIETGTSVRVKSGSVIPDDPISKAQQTVQLMSVLDPLSIAEGMGLDNPKEIAKRMMTFRISPDQYMTDYLQMSEDDGQVDQEAFKEHQMMLKGQEVPPQENPSKKHLATHNQLMQEDSFSQQSPEVQQLVANHVKQEVEIMKSQLGQSTEKEPIEQQETNPQEENGQGGLLRSILGRIRNN